MINISLSDIATVTDCEHKTAPLVDEGFPSIRTPNIGKGRLILEGVNYVDEKIYRLWTKRAVPKPGDIILAREAPVGNAAIIPKGLIPCLGQRTVLISPRRDKVVPEYLNYLLNSKTINFYLINISNGATVGHLNVGDIRNLALPELPPLPTQRKIAAILSAYDELIENNNRRIAILEKMAEEIYREWFVRLRFPGHENVKIVKGVPEGWEVRRIGEFFEIKRGKTISSQDLMDGLIPVVGGGLSHSYYHNKSNTVSPTITISSSGANAGYVNLYYENIWASDCSFTDSTMTDTIFYLYLMLKAKQDEIFFLQKGSAQPHVYSKDVILLRNVFPTYEQIQIFEATIRPIFGLINNLFTSARVLKSTRDLLLPRLISGKLDVEKLDIAFPPGMKDDMNKADA